MVHQSQTVGWTDARQKRLRLITWLLAAPAGLVLWAAFMPWAGLTISTTEPTCATERAMGSIQVLNDQGQVVQVTAAGCVSAYHSAEPKPERGTGGVATTANTQAMQRGMSAAGESPGSMAPGAVMGLPKQTFYALAAAGLVIAGSLWRNAFVALPAAFMWMLSGGAFEAHRTYLMSGMGSMGAEMYGVQAHMWAYWLIGALGAPALWLVLKGNSEQRKLDGTPNPMVRALEWAGETILRARTVKVELAEKK